MANVDIGSLDFKLHIDDKEFNKSVDAALKKAQQLNTSMSTLLDIRRQYNRTTKDDVANAKNANRVLREENKTREMNRREIIRTRKELVRLNAEKARAAGMGSGGNLATQLGMMNSLTSLAARYVSLWGAASLVKNIANVTAEFELQRTALRAMIGDVMKADQVYGKIWDLALRSPFNAKELTAYAKQLVAYSIPVEELYETTKMLADVSAGLGVGMDRLVLAYGQIRSASFLRGQEVRQLTEAGIPILEELRKQFVELGEEGIKAGDVFDKISKRMVSFEMVEKVFKNMTSEGGKFYQMQEVQAETLKGKIMILKDAYDKLFNTIGEQNSGMLKGTVEWITNLARNYEKTIGVIKVLLATFGAYKTALAMIKVAEAAVMASDYIRHIKTTTAWLKSLGVQATTTKVALGGMSSAKLAKGFATLAGAVAMVSAALIVAIRNAGEFNRELDKIASQKFLEAEKSVNQFSKLANELQKATKGSQNYRDAISKLNNQYGEYLPNLLNEKNALDEIAKNYNKVTNAIYANAKAYAYEESMRKAEEKYGTALADAQAVVAKRIENLGYGKDVAKSFVLQLTEGIKDMGKLDSTSNFFGELWKQFFGSELPVDMTKYNSMFAEQVKKIQDNARKLAEAQQDATDRIDLRFSNVAYSTAAEAEKIGAIVKKYEENVASIKQKELPADKVENELLEERKRYLTEMVESYKELEELAASEGKEGSWMNKIKQYENELKSLENPDLSWLQKIVNPIAEQMRQGDLAVKDRAETISDYADKIRKEYKTAAEALTDATGAYNNIANNAKSLTEEDKKRVKEDYENAEARKKTLETIAAALGITLKEPGSSTSAKTQAQKDIEHRISILKEFEGWYDKLRDLGMNDNDIRETLSAFFPDEKVLRTSADFRTELMRLADSLEKFDKDAAESLRNDVLGYDMDDYYDKLKKAIETNKKLQGDLKKLKEETLIEGTGVSYDLSKVIHDYQKAMRDITDQFNEVWADAYKSFEEGNYVDVEGLMKQTGEWFTVQSQNAMNKAVDAVDNLADKWIKEWAKIEGVDLEHWSDMSISQLKNVKNALESMFDENGELIGDLSEKWKAIFTDKNGTFNKSLFDEFVKSIKKYLGSEGKEGGGLIGKVFDEIDEKKLRLMKYAATSILALSDSLVELGDALGNNTVKDLGGVMRDISSMASDVAEGFAAGGWWGAAIGALKNIGVAMLQNAAAAELQNRALEHTANVTSRIYNWDKSIDRASNTIFGADDLAALQATIVALDELNATFAETVRMSGEAQEGISGLSDEVKKYFESWSFTTSSDAKGAFGWLTKFFKNNEYTNIKKLASKLGYQLYDEYGYLNAEFLRQVLSLYSDDLNAAEKDWLNSAIEYSEKATEYIKKIEESMSSLVGSVADSYAEDIVNQWVEMGNAAADYADILDDVARSYAKMVVKNMLMDEVFNKINTEELTRLTIGGQADKALAMLDQALGDAKALAPVIEPFLQGLNEYFQTAEAKSLSGGIKGITEDTANLLASYLNGMRGDLALQRIAVESISTDVRSVAVYIPTLDDYLAQIAGNTYDAAQRSQQILDRLNDVISVNGDSAYKLRVAM